MQAQLDFRQFTHKVTTVELLNKGHTQLSLVERLPLFQTPKMTVKTVHYAEAASSILW